MGLCCRLSHHVSLAADACFRLTRCRCWKAMTLDGSVRQSGGNLGQHPALELFSGWHASRHGPRDTAGGLWAGVEGIPGEESEAHVVHDCVIQDVSARTDHAPPRSSTRCRAIRPPSRDTWVDACAVAVARPLPDALDPLHHRGISHSPRRRLSAGAVGEGGSGSLTARAAVQ
jgi:hypothetical protein